MTEVARVSGIEPAEFIERFERPEFPVVIEGGVAQQRAVQRWTPDYLKQKIGQVELEYKLSASHQHPNFRAGSLREMFGRERSTFAEFLDAITTGPDAERARRLFTGDERFLLQRRDGQTRKDEILAPLLDDIDLPPFVPEERLYTIWGWFSGRGVRTWLHYDNNGCHNLNAQLTGEKRCLLYPPSELCWLRPFPLGGPNPAHNCSEIDVEEAAPPEGLAQARSLQTTLRAGDLLFIPAWWFHTFLHLGEFNSNVNFWWKPERSSLNPVAARQALLDAVAAAGVDSKPASPHAELLARLDDALVKRR